MKTLLISLVAFGAAASASAVEIKITSFQNIGYNSQTTRGAEVCGKVMGMEGNMVPLKVTTDYNSGYASDYVTFTTPQGNYCQVIQTYLGRVEVSLAANRGLNIQSVRAEAEVEKKKE